MTERDGHIHERNNAPRRGGSRSSSKTINQLLHEVVKELETNAEGVGWPELRRVVWTGDRYRLRFVRDRLIAAKAISMQKRGRSYWITPSIRLAEVTVSELRVPSAPVILKSRKTPGKYQVECTGCNTLVNRVFDSRDEASQWFWGVHVLTSVAHR